MGKADENVGLVLRGLTAKGITAFETANEELPDIVIADKILGFYAIDVVSEDVSDRLTSDEVKKLANRRLRDLRREVGDSNRLLPFKYVRAKVPGITAEELANISRAVRNVSLTSNELYDPDDQTQTSFIESIGRQFSPNYLFQTPRKTRTSEVTSDRSDREITRFRLDGAQQRIADSLGSEVNILTGPAGSGKTLVLVARARRLLAQHPDWIVQVVCYNNALKPYLLSILPRSRNLRVETFHEFITRTSHRFRMVDATEALAERQLREVLYVSPCCDALLIDEGQDFFPAWLKFLLMNVRENKGGSLIVGDENQSLYRTSTLASLDLGQSATCHKLDIPYRSTKQILDFTNLLVPEVSVDASEDTPSGPLPDLVYVQGGLANDNQAVALAIDIQQALRDDPTLTWKEIGILCSRHFEIKGLAGVLRRLLGREYNNPEVISPLFKRSRFGYQSQEFDPSHESIKLMTMHSAKGLEFKVVFLVGLELVAKEIEALPANALEAIPEAKLNLVGPTRAKDKLTVYYSRDNVFLKRLAAEPEKYTFRKYPDDYLVEEKWLN